MPEYQQGGGLSAGWGPKLDPEQQQSAEVQKLLFQHSKPYAQRYEEWQTEHPIKDFALQAALNEVPGGKILSRMPGAIGSFGRLYQAAQRVGSSTWGEGANIAPEHRHPFKKEMLDEMKQRFEEPYYDNTRPRIEPFGAPQTSKTIARRRHLTDFEYGNEQPGTLSMEVVGPRTERPASLKMRANWEGVQKLIQDRGENGPYKVMGFRGERGDQTKLGGPVPGRGRYYATQPHEAMDYSLKDLPKEYWAPENKQERWRWMELKGRGYDKYHRSGTPFNPDLAKLKGVRVEDLELKKPLVYDKREKSYEYLGQRLGLDEKEISTVRALEREWKNAPASRARWHRVERFWARKARDLGYDSLVEHGEGGTQIIMLEPKTLGKPLP